MFLNTHLDVVNDGGKFFHFLTGTFVDGFQSFDGLRGFLNVGKAFVQVLMQFLHLSGEVFIEVIDLLLEVLVVNQNLFDFADIVEEGADGLIRYMQVGLRIFGEFADFLRNYGEPTTGSPARAASIAALRASRFICAAISLIIFMTSSIFWVL